MVWSLEAPRRRNFKIQPFIKGIHCFIFDLNLLKKEKKDKKVKKDENEKKVLTNYFEDQSLHTIENDNDGKLFDQNLILGSYWRHILHHQRRPSEGEK